MVSSDEEEKRFITLPPGVASADPAVLWHYHRVLQEERGRRPATNGFQRFPASKLSRGREIHDFGSSIAAKMDSRKILFKSCISMATRNAKINGR